MKRRLLTLISALLMTALLVSSSCGDDDNGSISVPNLVKLSPADGATDVETGADVYAEFDQTITVRFTDGSATVNGEKATMNKVDNKQLNISGFDLKAGQTYKIVVSAGTVDGYDKQISWSFTTKKAQSSPDDPVTPTTPDDPEEPVTPYTPSTEPISTQCINAANASAQKVYDFLYNNYGKKIISGSMANVSMEQKEAALVKAATGKTPLMQTFDFCFVTLTKDRSTWEQNSIYHDISHYKELWDNGGIVSACWHLNVPSQEAYAAKNEVNDQTKAWNAQVYFSAKNAVTDGTWENEFIKFAFDKAAEVLLEYKEAGIAVVWRPFHEGSGNATITGKNSDAWFWWGKDGAQAYKKLWVYMFDYFKAKGIDNLIWVWTTQMGVGSDGSENWFTSDDSQWYPGSQYVDIIARDNYDKAEVSKSVQEFQDIQKMFPDKMAALGENGGIANISEIFAKGGKFSYFMPWYTHNLTNLDKSDHAKTAWWLDAAECEDVLFLEDVKP